MFTGIVEELGRVEKIKNGSHSMSVVIKAEKILADTQIGDSISVNGVCLTVTEVASGFFSADVMHETLKRSAFKELGSGTAVNLERAMPVNGRFGGHIVSGHIDGTGIILEKKRDDNAVCFMVRTAPEIVKYIIEKGSVAIDGISLTVTTVKAQEFGVSVIPHTLKNTSLSLKQAGSCVNIENDCIGKYVEKLLTAENALKQGNLTKQKLLEYGF